ncbi:hypothetical protein [Psychrobium sp. 1_MG-2023]|uniref:hypothetical protein n=1 Tax=Psychrobium sp. 1_MG-2023 TaxID=3062624 RepID=UPI001291D293|nr:hypothetical protein [Psychrobium sp. 1_MG-2023]MDP2562768.1 hypothetical protein [Psychrobium sp. 1_MG-2023]
MSLFKGYIATDLFGAQGAYSYEDQLLIMEQTSVVIVDLLSTLLLLAIPCFISAKNSQGHEQENSLAMLAAISLLLLLFQPLASVIVISILGIVIATLSAKLAIILNKKHN